MAKRPYNFFYPCASVFLGNLETNSVPRARDPLVRVACELGSKVNEVGTRSQIGQKPKNSMAASGVVKVLVSFYRSGEDSAFERYRSRVLFDLAKQSSVEAVKKHLTEFLGFSNLALKFGMKRVFIFEGITETGAEKFVVHTHVNLARKELHLSFLLNI